MKKKPAKRKRGPKVQSRVSIVMFSGTVTVNGVTADLPPIDYERVEYSDGTVKERGKLPKF